MTTRDGESGLAEALRRILVEANSLGRNEDMTLIRIDTLAESALAAWDAGKGLRDAERAALDCLEDWRQYTTPDDALWMSAEDASLLHAAEELFKLRQAHDGKET